MEVASPTCIWCYSGQEMLFGLATACVLLLLPGMALSRRDHLPAPAVLTIWPPPSGYASVDTINVLEACPLPAPFGGVTQYLAASLWVLISMHSRDLTEWPLISVDYVGCKGKEENK